MFDLTREVVLEPIWQKRYRQLRWVLYLLFALGSFYFAYRILFPSQTFSLNTTSRKTTSSTTLYDSGFNQNAEFLSAYSSENFSNATIQIVVNKQAPSLEGKKIFIRKTYQAFAYPTADQSVSSPAAKPANDIFPSGTLLSFDDSVFIVVDDKVMPFNNPITFLSFGYQWSDVIPATEAEIGLYQRDKLFTINLPHPNGTVFLTRDTNKYFLVQGGQKLEIKDADVLKTYSEHGRVPVDEKSLNFEAACVLKKNLWPFNSYSCTIPVTELRQFPGNDYQFKIEGLAKTNMAQASVVFSRNVDWLNLRDTLSEIKHKALINYDLESAN